MRATLSRKGRGSKQRALTTIVPLPGEKEAVGAWGDKNPPPMPLGTSLAARSALSGRMLMNDSANPSQFDLRETRACGSVRA